MKKIICGSILVFLVNTVSFAQPSIGKLKSNISKGGTIQNGIQFKSTSSTQAGILLRDNYNLPEINAKAWIEQQLEVRQGIDELRIDDNVAQTPDDITVKKLHQYYRNIKVEHGTINMSFRDNKMAMAQFEFYSIKDDFNTRPFISENDALRKALAFLPAEKYEWADAATAAESANAPHAELLIMKDYENDNEVCLAYKFDITTLQPFSSAYIYVNAKDGRIMLNNPQARHIDRNRTDKIDDRIKREESNEFTAEVKKTNILDYTNSLGSAETKYNNSQYILTDANSGITGKPYRLREKRNATNIETYNMQQKEYNSRLDNYATSIDILDNDNVWTTAEFNNTTWDNAALDAHFAMQIVSDYWLLVHNRRSWDNNNSAIKSYVHATEFKKAGDGNWYTYFIQNAFWFKKRMTFGDGFNTLDALPWTSFDICAHEMGHAITETTCDLIYQWESGALNEAFSDIWAACITDYAKQNYNLTNENTWKFGEKTDGTFTGFRDMSNPGVFSDPSAYKNPNWKTATLQTCRDFSGTDNCGVHSNSGVLNKWFYLITNGQQGTNSFGTPFNVSGLGFATSEKIAYLTELNLTPNASYQTCRTVSLYSTATLFGNTSPEYQSVWNAWVAVAVDSNVYNTANTPVFTTNNFTSIAVGKNGIVMAGTNYSGVYKFVNNDWTKMPDLTDVKFNDIKADYYGNFWIAQSGRTGTVGGGSSIAGGVNHYSYPFTDAATLFTVGAQTDVPSRNGRCIYIDTFRNVSVINPSVWVATTSYITSNNSTSGMLGHGTNLTTPVFTNVSEGINIGSGTAGCLTLGGNKDVIWTFVQANNGINQLLTYNAVTNALIETFDHNTHPVIPSGFVARSIYCDEKKRTWIGLAAGGIIVFDENRVWHYLSPTDFPQLFPAGAQASFNAIAGNKESDVYIGTTNGLVFFERGDGTVDRIDQAGSYKSYGKANGLPSSVINAITYDTLRFKVLVATDSGIIFWEPLCISPYCKQYQFAAKVEVQTIANGNWSNPAIWSNNKVPDSLTSVTIKHNVNVDINGNCSSISVNPSVSFIVQSGKTLTIYTADTETIFTSTGQQRRRRR